MSRGTEAGRTDAKLRGLYEELVGDADGERVDVLPSSTQSEAARGP